MDDLANVVTRSLLIEVKAEDKLCDAQCPHFTIFSTGLIGEWHPRCELFHENGEWREHTMKRAKECLKAEKAVMKKCAKM